MIDESKMESENTAETKTLNGLGDLYDSTENGAQRIDFVIHRLEKTIYEDSPINEAISYEKSSEIIEKIKELDTNLSRDEFQKQVYETILPLINLEINHPDLVKEANELWIQKQDRGRAFKEMTTKENSEQLRREKREQVAEEKDKVIVSETLYYEIKETAVYLHILPAMDLPVIAFIKDVKNGLKKIAEFVNENEEILTVSGQSWIITDKPKLLEKLGFEVIPQEAGRESIAMMTREDFLKKYLKD